MSDPTRPVLRYLGGKWKLAPWVVQHFPPHETYLEPFGGAASVLVRKSRSRAEIYNDLDGEIVNLFRVLRDCAQADELLRQLELTPFARDELLAAYERTDEPIERARRLIVRSLQGFGSNPTRISPRTGFRSILSTSGSTPAQDWVAYPNCLRAIVERIAGVAIENRPAIDLIRRFGRAETLIYADPPYVHATRPSLLERGHRSDGYAHEMTDGEHSALLDELDASEAMVVLSGYANSLYDSRLKHWRRVERKTHADGGRPRVEVLWINPSAADRISAPLFAHSEVA